MYNIIKEHYSGDGTLCLTKSCAALGVSRAGYQAWFSGDPKPTNEFERRLTKEIRKILGEFNGYGYKRVTKELRRRQFEVNHKRIYGIMRRENLLCKHERKFKIITTDSNHNEKVYPNMLKTLEITYLNQAWAADITYIVLEKGFAYLAAILDLYSRKCIGWDLSEFIDTELTLNALNMALKNRKHLGLTGLTHHSDQGVQYASEDYVKRLKELGIKISMSRKGNPYDNAKLESFIKTLKYEEVNLSEYESIDEARKNIKKFIGKVYNKKRLHSSIGYVPPDEFEKKAFLAKMGA